MAKYKVYATMITDLVVEVEAESEEEAKQIADEMDGSEFHDVGTGDFHIEEAVLDDREEPER